MSKKNWKGHFDSQSGSETGISDNLSDIKQTIH